MRDRFSKAVKGESIDGVSSDGGPARDQLLARRAILFRETPKERLERWGLGTAWALHPKRIAELPAVARVWAADLVGPQSALPDPERTFNAAGLAGMVHDVSGPTLVEAYRNGLFTFAHFGPLKWLS